MQADPSPALLKNALRREIRGRLRETPPGDGAAVCAAVAAWMRRRPLPGLVASYAAYPGEVDLEPLFSQFPQCRWALPRIEGDVLIWHEVRDPAADLAPGSFGIREPLPQLPRLHPSEIDLWLCPGLGFDAAGGRLGKGRAFYDRSLALARAEATRIGVCHPVQRVANVHAEAHDVPMHLVIDGTAPAGLTRRRCGESGKSC